MLIDSLYLLLLPPAFHISDNLQPAVAGYADNVNTLAHLLALAGMRLVMEHHVYRLVGACLALPPP